MSYDRSSRSSIVNYAKKLEGKSLSVVSEYKGNYQLGKGSFGNLVESLYFKYEPNSKAEPDFPEVKLELKCTPLKKLKKGDLTCKERLVLGMINYNKVVLESFDTSSFLFKNSSILFVFYLHDNNKSPMNLEIVLVDDWDIPLVDREIIKQDWEKIVYKIKQGRAHELSEGDTIYLGACTKGATADSSWTSQPYSNQTAKKRAFSFKRGYLDSIYKSLIEKNKDSLNVGKVIIPKQSKKKNSESVFKNVSIEGYTSLPKDKNAKYEQSSFEAYFSGKFNQFLGLTVDEIESKLQLNLNKSAKSYYAGLSKAIIGIEPDNNVLEFEKADISLKTVRLQENLMPKEHISFPAFEYEKIANIEWEDCEFKGHIEKKYLFIFFKFYEQALRLEKVKFWNMPYSDILECRDVWERTKGLIKNGKIVREIKGNRRKTFFPSSKDSAVCHIRPHARNSSDTYPLPVLDVHTNLPEYTKHSFWLNSRYIRDKVFLGDSVI